MKRASGKTKSKTSKAAKKKSPGKSKKQVDLVEVRKDIANIVTGAAGDMTKAVVEEGRKGQLAPVKYLFEVAGLYPALEGSQAKPEGESLARTLLHRLGLPLEPMIKQEDEPPMKLSLPGAERSNEEAKNESENAGSQQASQNNQAIEKDAGDEDDIPVPARINPVE